MFYFLRSPFFSGRIPALFIISSLPLSVMAENTEALNTATPSQQNTIHEPAAPKQTSRKDISWGGEAEIGYVMTRGNTETDSLNLQLLLKSESMQWRNSLQFKSLNASDRNTTTAESYDASARSEYLLSENDFLFGSLRYEDDHFAGYDQRTTEVFGYGYRILHRADVKLSIESGIGARQTEQIDGLREEEEILRLGLNYEWRVSDTTTFKEDLFVEHGEENTLSESVTELKVKINSKLAMKLGMTVKHNSDVPAGVNNTDSKTAVTLVYDF